MTGRKPEKSLLWRGIFAAEPVLKRTVHHVVRPLLPLVVRLPAHDTKERHRAQGSRPRVTFLLLHAYGMTGIIRTALNVAGHLSERYDVEVVSVKRTRRKPFLTVPAGVKVTALDDRFARHGLRWKFIRGVLNSRPSHLFHVQDWRYPGCSLWTDLLIMNHFRGLTGVLITTRPGLNIMAARYAPPGVRTIGQEHMNLASHRPLLRASIQRHYPRLDVLAALTESDTLDYVALFPSGSPRVVRLPNAVPAIGGGQADTSAKVVIAAGRLSSQKGYDRLVPAWAPVAQAHPDWQLHIYGEGPERKRLEGLIAKHAVGGSLKLMGQSDRLGDAFAASSIFVLSSRREGLPMVILEAMSKGLPVVSFDCPTGPAELVVTDHNGVLVPEADVPALTKSLLEVIEDEELRARLGKGALETAARFDIDVIGQQWEDLVEELLAEAGLGQPDSGR